jgi:hypothetical protein
MYTKSSLLLATALAFASVGFAAPVTQLASRSISRELDTVRQPDGSGVILVQNRGRGGGGQRAGGSGGQRAAGANRGGNFNTNDFHRDVANSRNTSVNRNTTVNRSANVNANRNVNINGGCCNGNYDSGPNWGGVAAGVAVGAVVGAAANSAAQSTTYAAPPPTYPPGYVAPPPY